MGVILSESIYFRYRGASARVVPLDKYTYAVSNVYSKTRNAGEATNVMWQIVSFADERDIILCLVVQRYGYADRYSPDNMGLVEFYEKFGFKVDSQGWPTTMRRHPSQELHVL